VLDARVFAQCWMPFGQRRQICCEQIEITASDATLGDVPAVVLPLAVADLPVILWCRSPRIFRLPAFSDLARIAHKLIVDSESFPSARDIVPELAAAAAKQPGVPGVPIMADLAWTRLTRWRELISQIFENCAYLSRLPDISQIRIGFRGSQPPASACYLAAWLLAGLESAGAKPGLQWQRNEANGSEKIGAVEFTGLDLSISVAVRDRAAEITMGSLVNRMVFSEATDYVLLREELAIPGRDPIYEKTVARAAALAVQ
jgi:glucose-6-phosphate dehydrogenase assembly protein OpcA